MKKEEHKVSVRVPEALKKSLEKSAADRSSNVSAFVIMALEKAVNPTDDVNKIIDRINLLEKLLQIPETHDRLVLSVLEDLSYHVNTLVLMLTEDFAVPRDRQEIAYKGFLRRAMEGVVNGDLATGLKELLERESGKSRK